MEKNIRVAGIVMASGFSRRMGRDKLLMDIGGRAIVERVIGCILESNLSHAVAVCRDEAVLQMALDMGMEAVMNENAHKGQSESIKAGIAVLEQYGRFDGYMFIPGDMPFLKSSIVDMILDEFEKSPGCITIPTYKGQRKSPVIFPASLLDELLSLEGESTGRDVIKRHEESVNLVETGCKICGIDIDTIDEYLAFKGMEND